MLSLLFTEISSLQQGFLTFSHSDCNILTKNTYDLVIYNYLEFNSRELTILRTTIFFLPTSTNVIQQPNHISTLLSYLTTLAILSHNKIFYAF